MSFCEDTKDVHYNPYKKTPILVEGDVQIFADPECTQYATGVVDKVYARINRDFGFGESCSMSPVQVGVGINCPSLEVPDDTYSVYVYIDFASNPYESSFTAGQVVECTSNDAVDVTDYDKIFTYIPEFVDLNLPSGTKWAKCNLGATIEDEYGKYFSWGNIDGVTSVDTEGIAAMTQAAYAQTKGATLTGDIPATAEYDAAVARFQGIADCQIPTQAQFQELVGECTWTWQNNYNDIGIKGYLVTSKTNGNSIFLPAGGYVDNGLLDYTNYYGNYWSSALDEIDGGVHLLFYSGSDAQISYDDRSRGYSIRPVQNP